jgi:hypothetical protein
MVTSKAETGFAHEGYQGLDPFPAVAGPLMAAEELVCLPPAADILDVLLASGLKDLFDATERERIAALVRVLEESGDEPLLDEAVHECHGMRAAEVNNGATG